MTIVADLLALQELDSRVDADERELAGLRARVGDGEALQEARAAVAEYEARRRTADAEAKRLDTEVGDLKVKMRPVEQKLYDGSVTSPKELQSLQEDLEMLQRQQRALEDQQLTVMEELEASAAGLRSSRAGADTMEADWQREQESLRAREVELEAELGRVREQRRAKGARVEPAQLVLYERLRRTKRGLAVSRVERGACTGCRVTLPTTVQQRARSGMQVVQCPNCERILYAG